MTTFLLFLLYVAALTVVVPIMTFLTVKFAVLGYHVGVREAANTPKRVETSHARQGR